MENEVKELAVETTENLAAPEAGDGQSGQLTPEQIKNWRRALIGTLGSYALIMPDADIQRLRDRFQRRAQATSTSVSDGTILPD